MSEREPKKTISSRDKVVGEFERSGIDSIALSLFVKVSGSNLPLIFRIVKEREAADGVEVTIVNKTMDYDTAVMVAGWIDDHKGRSNQQIVKQKRKR